MSHHPVLLHRRARRFAAALPLLLAALIGPGAASAAALPAGCTHESVAASGAVDPNGLCVSRGYGRLPAPGASGPAFQNVVANAEGKVGMPIDYYVRSDLAQGIAAGTERPRAAYMLLFGGAFICGGRSELENQARELARRGYVVVAPEYPLAGALADYGYYKPNPGHDQESPSAKNANACDAFDQWVKTPAWTTGYLPKLKAKGWEPVLQESQLVLQTLVRRLKTDPSLGVDGGRIFALGSSAGGAVATRLALGGNNDRLPSGEDPGDSTIAGALSISGPACFAESRRFSGLILNKQIRPNQMAACRNDADPSDPPVVMLQEPRGGTDDLFVPSSFMRASCSAIHDKASGKCIYEDRTVARGGYVQAGQHAYVLWKDWLRLFDALAAQGVGQP